MSACIRAPATDELRGRGVAEPSGSRLRELPAPDHRRTTAPGQFVSQRELVQLLGMPLGAVRELIPRLEAEGLLRTVPQRGLQIAHVDLALINNAFQLRQVLEREAVARFCHSVSDADLAAIEDAHRASCGARRAGPSTRRC